MMALAEITQEMQDAIQKIADDTASDISNEFPEMDVSYDLWVEAFVAAGWPPKDIIYGVVDMGEAHKQVYEWYEGEWLPTSVDAFELIEHIIAKRAAR
jgi:hypothetical protein